MQKAILIFLIVLINTTISFGQVQNATTQNGQKVILRQDGTWEYTEDEINTEFYKQVLEKEETIKNEWAGVEITYQRRLDLIPNLTNILNDIPDFDKKNIVDIIEARAKIIALNFNSNNLSQENIDSFQTTQRKFSAVLSRVLVIAEQYPQLTSSQQFKDFTVELAGTENRINRNRYLYTEAVNAYNELIKNYPQKALATKYGIYPKGSFKSN